MFTIKPSFQDFFWWFLPEILHQTVPNPSLPVPNVRIGVSLDPQISAFRRSKLTPPNPLGMTGGWFGRLGVCAVGAWRMIPGIVNR